MHRSRMNEHSTVQSMARLAQPLMVLAILLFWLAIAIVLPRGVMAGQFGDIRVSEFAPILKEALLEKGAPQDSEISFAHPETVLPGEIIAAGQDAIQSIAYTPASGRFLVRMSAPGSAQKIVITGSARVRQTIPVLLHSIARNEPLREDNIDWVTTSESLPAGTLIDIEDMVGKIARRPLGAGVPIRARDTLKPVLVERGSLITMAYKQGGLTISHRAIAEESGGAGDVIRVRNPVTQRKLRALIQGRGEVAVIGPIQDDNNTTRRRTR